MGVVDFKYVTTSHGDILMGVSRPGLLPVTLCIEVMKKFLDNSTHKLDKLYFGYKYTRPCMINSIWGLKIHYLQVNGHALFHFHLFYWGVWNGKRAKHSRRFCSVIRTHARHTTKGKSSKSSRRVRAFLSIHLPVVECWAWVRIPLDT